MNYLRWKLQGMMGLLQSFDIDIYTKLLMHCDGVDNGTVITDEISHTITRHGNVCTKTGVKKFGTASLYFDGDGDYLTLDGSSDFAFGTEDFTIDMWVYLVSNISSEIYDSRPNMTNGSYFEIYLNSSGYVGFYINSTEITISSSPVSSNTWYHFAVVRSGTSTKLYINGTQSGSTYTDTNVYGNGANRPIIGGNGYIQTRDFLNGYIDELRVSKGIARWTSNFTPPTRPYTS